MEKERLIGKFKDYSKELEKILINKPYPKTAKNLLLNMFYKIENGYEDYKKIKIEVPSKQEFLQELLDIIYRDCKNIKIVKPPQEMSIEDNKIITYENEQSILEQLYKLNSDRFSIKSKNNMIGTAVSWLLNKGEEINKSEIIRDFDGWSWNPNEKEIKYKNASLVYLGIIYILGYYNVKKVTNIDSLNDLLKVNYKKEMADAIIKSMCQIAILEYINQNPDIKDDFLELKEKLQKKYEIINNKKEYIESISKEKKKCVEEVTKIDKLLGNDLLLKKEYIHQNSVLPQEKRVFSLSDFSEKIQNEKAELQTKIADLNEKLKPGKFLNEKKQIEDDVSFYNEIDFENMNTEAFIEEFIKLLIKTITEQIKNISTKRGIIDKLYIVRYLNMFILDESETIGEKYKKQIKIMQKKLITLGCNIKALTIFSKDVEENYLIYKNIFETRIIDFENLYIEITNKNKVKIFDDEALEKEEEYNGFNDLNIKYNKKHRIFL